MGEQGTQLKRTLGFFGVFIIGLSLLTPTTVFTTFGIASGYTKGHVPSVYLFAMFAILFTVLSYAAMVKLYPRSGSAYTYSQQAFNPNVGFMVGWGTLFDYLFLPIVYVLSVTTYMVPYFPGIPMWVWVVGTLLITTVSNVFNMKIAVSVSTVLIVLQLVISAVFIALIIQYQYSGNGEIFSLTPFYSQGLTFPIMLSGSVILAYGFIGFDAVSTLAEETKNPTKTLPKVMIALALFIGILYTTITYFMQVAFPDVSIFSAPDAAAMEIADIIGGAFFTAVFLGIIITAILVGCIAAQMGSSRLLYAMGRDKVFPQKIFGHLHPKSGIPVYNILLTGVFGLAAIFLTLDQAASIISFGAFTAFTFVNLSLIMHTIRTKNYGTTGKVIRNLVFPVIGTAFLGLMWYNIDPTALKLGIIWNIGGFIFLLFLTRLFKRQAPSLAMDEAHEA